MNSYALLSDLYKSAFGSRPSQWYMTTFNTWSEEKKTKEWEWLNTEADYQVDLEKQRTRQAVASFETTVGKVIAAGAGTREAALRWMTSEEKFRYDQDVERYVWDLGILFTEEGKKLVDELKQIWGIK